VGLLPLSDTASYLPNKRFATSIPPTIAWEPNSAAAVLNKSGSFDAAELMMTFSTPD
jgi:hypothetical protein